VGVLVILQEIVEKRRKLEYRNNSNNMNNNLNGEESLVVLD